MLSRVTRMIADQLLMASLLNLVNLEDPRDDGHFLVSHLETMLAMQGRSCSRLRELRDLEAAKVTHRRQRAGLP
jgi:hypothetical protein